MADRPVTDIAAETLIFAAMCLGRNFSPRDDERETLLYVLREAYLQTAGATGWLDVLRSAVADLLAVGGDVRSREHVYLRQQVELYMRQRFGDAASQLLEATGAQK
jgi:hypothetical protein